MSMEFLIETSDGKLYEISDLITSISWTDVLNDGCSKLEFEYLAVDLNIQNGNIVRFIYNSAKVFYGVVFVVNPKKNKVVFVTAYDQLRYCKAKDTVVCNKDSATTLVKKMCNYLNLNAGALADTGYTLATGYWSDKAWLDCVYGALDDTLRYNGKWFSLRDEFGSVCLRNLTDLETDLVIGDGSLCYDYNYKKSIDDDFYNQVKLAAKNESTGKLDLYVVKDSASIKKYGGAPLQYFETIDAGSSSSDSKSKKKSISKAQIVAKANALLKLYNGETETLTLDCLGDTSIRAGSSFHGLVSEILLNKRLIVKSATHTFLPAHTMSLEVRI